MANDLAANLRRTQDQLREENEHIAREKAFIEKAQAEGHDIPAIHKSLQAMRRFRHALKMHQRILLERLGLYRVK